MFYLFADWQISLGVLSKFEGSGGDLAPLGPKDNHVVGREADWIQRIGPVLYTVKRKNNKKIKILNWKTISGNIDQLKENILESVFNKIYATRWDQKLIL